MKTKIILFFGLFLMAGTNLMAVDLQNKDFERYDLEKYIDGVTTTNMFIQSHTTLINFCSPHCKIKVIGVGSIEASGSQVVVIENGELSIKK